MTRVVAIVGAECSGKTTLAMATAEALSGTYVPELLRSFVAEQGRPPRRDEQAALMHDQIRSAAQASRGWAVVDGGALMTAVYSLLYFDDDSLVDEAVRYHAQVCELTVWCGIDVPWQPDPGQRDGPEHRARADAIIAAIVAEHALPVLPVTGAVADRLAAVLGALDRSG